MAGRCLGTILRGKNASVRPSSESLSTSSQMTDRNVVLKWAHLGRGRPRPLRHREILEEEKRVFDAHVAKIWAEQEQKNAVLAERKARAGGRRLLVVTHRYAKGIAHHCDPEEQVT